MLKYAGVLHVPPTAPAKDWTIRLSSGLRHVGFELRFSLKHDSVAIEVWFWRAASRPVWERIKMSPAEYDVLIGENWKFEPVEGKERVLRGGSFVYGPRQSRCAFRGRNSPEFQNFYVGFRVLMEAEK